MHPVSLQLFLVCVCVFVAAHQIELIAVCAQLMTPNPLCVTYSFTCTTLLMLHCLFMCFAVSEYRESVQWNCGQHHMDMLLRCLEVSHHTAACGIVLLPAVPRHMLWLLCMVEYQRQQQLPVFVNIGCTLGMFLRSRVTLYETIGCSLSLMQCLLCDCACNT